MHHLCASISQQFRPWKFYCQTENTANLRHELFSENEFYSAHKYMTPCEYANTKLISMNLSTPSVIIEEKINDSTMKAMKKITITLLAKELNMLMTLLVSFSKQKKKINS